MSMSRSPAHPLGKDRPLDEVRFDAELFAYYQQLIQIREDNPALIHGDLEYVVIDDASEVLAYSRTYKGNEVIGVFNASEEEKSILVPVKTEGDYRDALAHARVSPSSIGVVQVVLPARRAGILHTN